MKEELCNKALYKLTKVTKQKAILESKTKKADYTTKLLSMIYCNAEAANFLLLRESISQKEKKNQNELLSFWEAESKIFTARFKAFYSRKISFEWKSSNHDKAFSTVIVFSRMNTYFRNINKVFTWLQFYLMDLALKN